MTALFLPYELLRHYFSPYFSLVETGVAQSVQWLCYGLDNRLSIYNRSRDDVFLFVTAFRQALGPNQPHIQGYRGLFSRGYGGRIVKLTT